MADAKNFDPCSLMQQECMSVYVSACQYVCLSSVAPALQKLSKAMSREKHHKFESAGYVCMSVLEKVLEKLLLKSSEMFWSFAKQSPTCADIILTENPCRWEKTDDFAMSLRCLRDLLLLFCGADDAPGTSALANLDSRLETTQDDSVNTPNAGQCRAP